MRGLIIITFFLAPLAGISQQPEGYDAFANLSGSGTHMFKSYDNRHEGLKGYPTLFEDFVAGEMMLKSNRYFQNISLNLDLFSDEIIHQPRYTTTPMVVNAREVAYFKLTGPDGTVHIFKPMLLEKKIRFTEVLFEGKKISFFCLHQKKIEKANYGGAYNLTDRRYDEFVDAKKYYLKSGSEEVLLVSLKRKQFSEAFLGEMRAQVESKLKESKLDFTDLKAIVQFLESIDRL